MKKSSKAYQLCSITKPVFAVKLKDKNGKEAFYPIGENEKELFVYGQGRIKVSKTKKRIPVKNLSNPFTAEEVKATYEQFGLNVVHGLIGASEGHSIFDDHSYYLEFITPEIKNMARFGKVYDDFTDKVQSIGDMFISKLADKGFKIEGNSFHINGHFVFFIDRDTPIHPLLYVDHFIGFRFFDSLPSFDPIRFDDMLRKIFFSMYYDGKNKGKEMVKLDEMLAKYESVYDRIVFLTDEDCAKNILHIFELQKVFHPEE